MITAEGIAANVKPSLVICAVARVNVASVPPEAAEPPYPAAQVPTVLGAEHDELDAHCVHAVTGFVLSAL